MVLVADVGLTDLKGQGNKVLFFQWFSVNPDHLTSPQRFNLALPSGQNEGNTLGADEIRLRAHIFHLTVSHGDNGPVSDNLPQSESYVRCCTIVH